MLRHILNIASRNLLKYFNYTLLNIVGLAIGITSFIFILIYINDELSYDRFHENSENIYRVNRLYNSNDIDEDAATCSFPFSPALQAAYPDMIKSIVRFFDFQISEMMFTNREDSTKLISFNERQFYLADSSVFQMFSFPLLEGDPATVLERPMTIVLSESAAKKYFGNEPAVGKTLWVEEQLPLEVSGIMKDLPSQSHFKIDILGSLSSFRQLSGGTLPASWIWNPCWTYVELHDQIKPEQLEARFPDFYTSHYADFQDQDITLYLQALGDIHLKSHHEYEMRPNSNISYIRILGIIGIAVLILACINFMNLATASSSGRGREIGMKKMAGASKNQLRAQFLGESLIITLVALAFSAVLVEVLLPTFNNFTAKNIDTGIVIQPVSLLIGLLLLIVVGIVSGSYPAFYLSSLSTSHMNSTLAKKAGKGWARKTLVVVQFLISVALIISTITAYSQLNFLRKADLGFTRDQIILLPTKFNLARQFDAFSEELKQHKDIEYVTGMEDVLGVNHNTRSVVIEGMFDDQAFWYPAFLVRYDFIETFDIQVVTGRAFSRDFASDTSSAIMINESMVKHLGWTNEEAIGKKIRMDGDEQVIGVFSDFNALSLHKPTDNFILDMLEHPGGAAALTRYIAIRVNSGDIKSVLAHIETIWTEFAPTRPFSYSFLDDDLNALYKDENSFAKLSLMLTILAIVIACLGIIGLTSFMAEQRTKEISVRRVHGASYSSVNALLAGEFLWLIGVSLLISWPLTYIVANRWLNTFSQHVEMQWYLFAFSGVITLAITLAITSLQTYRTTRANPADTLKYE